MRRFVEIDGKRRLWRDVLTLRRRAKRGQERRAQPRALELKADRRPLSQEGTKGRSASPCCSQLNEPFRSFLRERGEGAV